MTKSVALFIQCYKSLYLGHAAHKSLWLGGYTTLQKVMTVYDTYYYFAKVNLIGNIMNKSLRLNYTKLEKCMPRSCNPTKV